jgi:Ca-activated chloride channel family protein
MPALNSITFVWPWMLWLLLLIPLCVCIYLFVVIRSRKSNSLIASTSTALRVSSPVHRYLCNILLLLGLSFLIVCLARPKASMLLPTRIDSIMIAVDTSGSMQADDIAPSRIEAAKTTIKQFIAAQPTQVKLGIVTIASTAALIQAPTAERRTQSRHREPPPSSRIGPWKRNSYCIDGAHPRHWDRCAKDLDRVKPIERAHRFGHAT